MSIRSGVCGCGEEWPGRWGADAGIDLVVEAREGGLWAVQAKAYDPSYSVTKADVDTFLSESSPTAVLISAADRHDQSGRPDGSTHSGGSGEAGGAASARRP